MGEQNATSFTVTEKQLLKAANALAFDVLTKGSGRKSLTIDLDKMETCVKAFMNRFPTGG